jgi:hypothetical protein
VKPRLVLLASVALPSLAFGQPIPVQLLFDGKPLQTTARPEFSCLDTNRNAWIRCTVTTERWPDRYALAQPAPGRYVLHVTVNDNRGNPARFPGDYEVFHRFEVTPGAPVALSVDMPKLIRLRPPWDNSRDLAGMALRARQFVIESVAIENAP